MKTKVTVLTCDAGYKKYDGFTSMWCMAQCIVHKIEEDGSIRQEVGVLRVPAVVAPVQPKTAAIPDGFKCVPGTPYDFLPYVPAGDYMAEYGLAIDRKSKELVGQLKGLEYLVKPRGTSVTGEVIAPK